MRVRGEAMDRETVIKEMLKLLTLFDNLHGDTGSKLLKEEERIQLQEFHNLITPLSRHEADFSERLNAAAKHLILYLDAERAPVAGTTYSWLSRLIRRIDDNGLFDLLVRDYSVNSSAGGYRLNDESGTDGITSCISYTASSATGAFTCRVCLKSFSSSESRSLHESYHFCRLLPVDCHTTNFRVHVVRRKFSCVECSKMFFTASARMRHQKRHLFSTYRSSVVSLSWTKLMKKGRVGRGACFACELCAKVFRFRSCFLVHLQSHGFTTNISKDGAKRHCVTEKASENKCDDVLQHDDIDSMLENGTIDLCEQQDMIERCDEFLSSLDGSVVDDLTGAASVVRLGPLTFACTACGKEFASKTSAAYHLRLHCGHKLHVCVTCGKTFLDTRNLKKHERRHVPLCKRPKCVMCGAVFLWERCVLRHIDGSFQSRRCTLCGSQHRLCPESGRSLLGSHDSAVVAAEQPTVNCSAKDKRASSEISRANRRTPSVTSRRIGLQVSTTDNGQLNDHFSRSSDAKKWPKLMRNGVRIHECPDCGKNLTSHSNLVRHYRIHTGERPFTCLDCGRTFVDHGNMKKHARIHLGGRRPSVPIDSDLAEFQQLDSSTDPTEALNTGSGSDLLASELVEIKTELMYGHPDSSIEKMPLTSNRCKKTPNTYVCFVCNKTFPYKSSLEGHIRTHMDQRPYQCEICGKAFKRTCDLLTHSRFHDEQKQFECRDCGRRFRWKNGLDRHHRVHTGERPFLCNLCGRAFADWGSHKHHMRRHSGQPTSVLAERYPCKLCGRSFTWKRGLNRHTQQVHSWDTASVTA